MGFEDEITATIKCPCCKETLLFGRTACPYCEALIDEEYALRSVRRQVVITHACSRANTLKTISPLIILCGLAFIFCYIVGNHTRAIVTLIVTISYCSGVVAWRYRYGDIEIDDDEFRDTQRYMKWYLHVWLAVTSLQILWLLIWLVGLRPGDA